MVVLPVLAIFALVVSQCAGQGPSNTLAEMRTFLTSIELDTKQSLLSDTKFATKLASLLGNPEFQEAFVRIQSLKDSSDVANQLSIPENLQLRILQIVKDRFKLNKTAIKFVMKSLPPVLRAKARDLAPVVYAQPDPLDCPFPDCSKAHCDETNRYRTIDGTCNNLKRPLWGRAFRPLQRFIDSDYGDGIESPRDSIFGVPLPNARMISRRISKGKNKQDPVHTFLLTVFGQFLDHDITLTAVSMLTSEDENGNVESVNVKCGKNGCETEGEENRDCFPILIHQTDPEFPKKPCLMFVRSQASPSDNCKVGPREQLNQITSYIDASNIYGSTPERNKDLRDLSKPDRGRLRIEIHPLGFNGFLPYGEDEGCRELTNVIKCFMSGDARVNEHMGLTTLHTTFHRYHNLIEARLHLINPHWSGERLFQETRKIIGALWQHQVYNEFLPLVLGPDVMKRFGLNLDRSDYWDGYDHKVNAEIGNVFATAAFRFGHSSIPNEFKVINKQGVVEEAPLLSQVFNRPKIMYKKYASGASPVDAILRGMYQEPMNRIDKHFTRQVTAKLFSENPPKGPGTDLFALNIQRGRDHGIPGYTAWRKWCGLSVPKNLDDLQDIPKKQRWRFGVLYKDVDDIDLFPAGILERRVLGGVVGPTLACIIAKQFRNLRVGDRFWHERSDKVTGFTPGQLSEIRKTLVSRVICDTGDDVDYIQRYALLQPLSEAFKNVKNKTYRKIYSLASLYRGWKNEPEYCTQLPDIDLWQWKEY